MNQQKYILSAVLVVVVGAAIFLGFKKFPQDSENTSTIIDYDEPIDTLSKLRSDGKRVFMSRCASCHHVLKDATGPALSGITERGPWKDSKMLYKYIREPNSFQKSKYVDSLRQVYRFNHTAFPDLTDYEIEEILRYINVKCKSPVLDL